MKTATFPVEINFAPPSKKYAKGGLAAKAADVQDASVGPDTKLIHVNEKEYEWLKSQFGPPAKNPKTGLDTFGFLDFLIPAAASRSAEHTSELQSRFGRSYAVCCSTKKRISSILTPHHRS